MTNCDIEKVIARAQDEVYNATIDDLVWHIEYHRKKANEYAREGDVVLFEFNFEKFKAYKKILAHFKTLKF